MNLKCLIDIATSAIGLTFLSPFLLCIALCIKSEDRGPVFYRGLRVGLNEKLFGIYKFRTMVVNADKIGGPTTSACDSRITRIGAWLRKNKLDELPQLLNVLKGEMSLVGPRPEVASEVKSYGPEWQSIFSVRPGITDLSSIEFRNEGEIIASSGIEDPHEAYRQLIQPRKLELQRYYAINHSMPLDIQIICETLLVVVAKR